MPLLKIDIEARYAQFQDALNAIQRDTKKAAGNMSKDFASLKGTLAGIGAAVSVGGIAAMVKQAIDAADTLRDLSQQTGVAVTTLGGLGFAAGQAGGSLESIAEAAGKLNKSIAAAAGGDKKIADGFKALGIEVTDAAGKLKKADQVMVELADKFKNYADGPEKVAIANRLMKGTGAELISFLNEGGTAIQENIEFYKRFSGATEDMSDKADEFNDAMGKLKLISSSVGNSMAREVLPVLNLVSQELIDSADGADKFSLAGTALKTLLETLVIAGSDIAHTFNMVGDEFGGMAARVALLANGDFKLAWNLGDIMNAEQEAKLKKLEKSQQNILNPAGAKKTATIVKNWMEAASDMPKPPAPRLVGDGPDGSAKILAGRLAGLERMSDDERQLLASRTDFLQAYFAKDLISIGDYYDSLRAYQEESLKNRKALIQQEIDAVRASKPKDADEAADKKNKVADLQTRMAALKDDAERVSAKLLLEQDSAAKAYASTLKSINAELLEQIGLLPEAAAIRFDQSNQQVRQRINVQRDSAIGRGDDAAVAEADAALAQLDTIRAKTVAMARLNSISDAGAQIQDRLAEATERAHLAAETGNATELASLRTISDARMQAVADLSAVADSFDKVAQATGNEQALRQARALRLDVDKLAASADLVRKKFEGAFQAPFDNFIDKLTSGTASLKDTIKGLFNDVASELTKIAARDLTSGLFAEKGKFGGIVDLAASVFGGAPATAKASPDIGAVGADAGLAAIAATAPITDFALAGLTLAAENAAIALASISASKGGGEAIDMFSEIFDGGGFAKGGAFHAGAIVPFAKGGVKGIVDQPTLFSMSGGRTGLMGEAGPEAIMPLTRGKDGLSVTMIDERGKATLLPVMRDAMGSMAVRGKAQAFATGGVFSRGTLMAAANTVQGMQGSVEVARSKGDGQLVVNNNFTINGQANAATQGQIAAAAALGVQRGKRNL